MNDWLKLGVTLLGFGVITWSAVQQHEFRIDKLENSFEQHLDKHDAQNKEVLKAIQSLEIQITRIQK